jgi:hypothetical protein
VGEWVGGRVGEWVNRRVGEWVRASEGNQGVVRGYGDGACVRWVRCVKGRMFSCGTGGRSCEGGEGSCGSVRVSVMLDGCCRS